MLAKDGQIKIWVGADDGQTISIDLKKIDFYTLGLKGFSVSSNTLKMSDSITQVGASGSLKDVALSCCNQPGHRCQHSDSAQRAGFNRRSNLYLCSFFWQRQLRSLYPLSTTPTAL